MWFSRTPVALVFPTAYVWGHVPAYQLQKVRQAAKLARHDHAENGQYLGTVEAPNEKAEAVAIKQFELDDDQRRRLLIRLR